MCKKERPNSGCDSYITTLDDRQVQCVKRERLWQLRLDRQNYPLEEKGYCQAGKVRETKETISTKGMMEEES